MPRYLHLTVLAVALAALVTPWPSSQPAAFAAGAPKAYVGLFKDNAVAVLDTGSNAVITTIPVPPGPHGIVVTPDGRKVYVSSDGASTVSVIDATTDQVTSTVEVGREPHGLAITPDGSQVLVGGWGANTVAMIDTSTDQIVGQVEVAAAHNIAISPDGRWGYVGSQQQGAPALVVLDLASRTTVANVPIEKNPRGLSFSPDGKWLHVTMAGLDAVAVLDPATNQIVAQIPTGPSPHFPLFAPNGLGLVDSQGLGQLATLDANAHTVAATIQVGERPHWTATTPDSRTAYVTNEGSNDVSVVDLSSMAVTTTVPIGNAPRKIAIQPVAPTTAQGGVTTRIAGFAFEPKIAVTVGQTVTWTNADSVPHTVTSADRSWDSGPLTAGASYSLTPVTPGAYDYLCSEHSYMRGTLVVGG